MFKVSLKKINLYFVFFIFVLLLLFITSEDISAQSLPLNNQIQLTDTVSKPISSTFDIISGYQEKYFEIINRNNVLLNNDDSEDLTNDRKELDGLFNEIKARITNERFLKKYNKIQKRFANCDAITTTGINECANKNYDAIYDLLNNVYKKVESKLSFEESKKLALSQIEWEKMVDDYQNVYNSMNFGTIGTSIYYSYKINMIEFRTLLLMLYL